MRSATRVAGGAVAISRNSLDKRGGSPSRGRLARRVCRRFEDEHFCSSRGDEGSLMSRAVALDVECFTAERMIGRRVVTHLAAIESTTNIRVAFRSSAPGLAGF
jgi:hypothetical protein